MTGGPATISIAPIAHGDLDELGVGSGPTSGSRSHVRGWLKPQILRYVSGFSGSVVC